ncbi:hypothetical protein HS7_13690 [Sulfolobales archaeon HS-7]|nr:hypothetical protein HS7_13690 [Sulfolobales archaeon HS-7]
MKLWTGVELTDNSSRNLSKLPSNKVLLLYWIAFVITLISFFFSSSPTLLAEAVHSMTDAVVITITFYALTLVNNRDPFYTYGMHRLETLSSVVNIGTVILGSMASLALSVSFLLNHIPDNPEVLTAISSADLLLSIYAVRNSGEVGGVKVHSILDSTTYTMGIGAGLLVLLTHDVIIDPLMSFAVIGVVILQSISQLRDSFSTLMERSPVDVNDVTSELLLIFPNVHDVHVWNICSHMRIATCHIIEDPNLTLGELDTLRKRAEAVLREKFGIGHVTIQFESKQNEEDY